MPKHCLVTWKRNIWTVELSTREIHMSRYPSPSDSTVLTVLFQGLAMLCSDRNIFLLDYCYAYLKRT